VEPRGGREVEEGGGASGEGGGGRWSRGGGRWSLRVEGGGASVEGGVASGEGGGASGEGGGASEANHYSRGFPLRGFYFEKPATRQPQMGKAGLEGFRCFFGNRGVSKTELGGCYGESLY